MEELHFRKLNTSCRVNICIFSEQMAGQYEICYFGASVREWYNNMTNYRINQKTAWITGPG
jgi:hypothetical protein